MGTSDDLLRMLEPAVRPGNLPAPVRAAQAPIEQQNFGALLAQAQEQVRELAADTAPAPATTTTAKTSPPRRDLADLSGLDRIENAGLRDLLARTHSSPPTEPA